MAKYGRRMSGTDTEALPYGANHAAKIVDALYPSQAQQVPTHGRWPLEPAPYPHVANQSEDVSLMSTEPPAPQSVVLGDMVNYEGTNEYDTIEELFSSEIDPLRFLTAQTGNEWGFEALMTPEGRYKRTPLYEGTPDELPESARTFPLEGGSVHGSMHTHPSGALDDEFSWNDIGWTLEQGIPLGMVSDDIAGVHYYEPRAHPSKKGYLPRSKPEDFGPL